MEYAQPPHERAPLREREEVPMVPPQGQAPCPAAAFHSSLAFRSSFFLFLESVQEIPARAVRSRGHASLRAELRVVRARVETRDHDLARRNHRGMSARVLVGAALGTHAPARGAASGHRRTHALGSQNTHQVPPKFVCSLVCSIGSDILALLLVRDPSVGEQVLAPFFIPPFRFASFS